MINSRLIKSNDAGGGVCQSDITDIFEDGSGVALYQLNWDGSDMSGNYDGVATNVSFVNGKIDSAGSFNGSSSYVSINDSTDLRLLGSYSISFWLKRTANGITARIINKDDGTDHSGGYALYLGSSNKIEWVHNTGSNNSVSTGYTPPLDTWVNCVAVYNTTGNTRVFYVNGSSVYSGTTNGSLASSTDKLFFGTFGASTPQGQYLNGDLDQVRIFNKALSASEVTTLYNEVACEKTCTTDDNQLVSDCIAYYKLDGNADDALNTYDGTPTNVSWTQGRFGSAAGFNGSSSKIQNSTIDFNNTDCSVSFWVKLNDTNPTNQTILTTVGGAGWYDISQVGTNLNIFFNVQNGFSIPSPSIGNWHNIVLTVTGTTASCYLNGVYAGGATGTRYYDDSGITLGSKRDGADRFFNGSIDQVRIYDRAITVEEVTTLYNEVACPSGASFNTVLFTPTTSTAPLTVGGVGFQPDFVWFKYRSGVQNHYLFDSIRGENLLRSNTTDAELISPYLSSFNNDGFTTINNLFNRTDADSVVAWCWKAGGDAVTNTDGTITSEVSANVDAGFSIVSYTGNNVAGATIGHGLNQTPEMVIIKNRDNAFSWSVRHSDLDSDKNVYLNATNEATIISTTGHGGVGVLSSSNFSFISGSTTLNNVNALSDKYIAYCFHSVAGFSKFGSWNNIGSTGTIDMGFEPAMIIIKKVDGTDNWRMYDNKRDPSGINNKELYPNLSNAEYTLTNFATFTNNGLDFTGGNSFFHSGEFIYMAFANQF